MSIIKAIKKCEYDFEVRAEKFLWHHPVLGFFWKEISRILQWDR